jgi:hypothetical protein
MQSFAMMTALGFTETLLMLRSLLAPIVRLGEMLTKMVKVVV